MNNNNNNIQEAGLQNINIAPNADLQTDLQTDFQIFGNSLVNGISFNITSQILNEFYSFQESIENFDSWKTIQEKGGNILDFSEKFSTECREIIENNPPLKGIIIFVSGYVSYYLSQIPSIKKTMQGLQLLINAKHLLRSSLFLESFYLLYKISNTVADADDGWHDPVFYLKKFVENYVLYIKNRDPQNPYTIRLSNREKQDLIQILYHFINNAANEKSEEEKANAIKTYQDLVCEQELIKSNLAEALQNEPSKENEKEPKVEEDSDKTSEFVLQFNTNAKIIENICHQIINNETETELTKIDKLFALCKELSTMILCHYDSLYNEGQSFQEEQPNEKNILSQLAKPKFEIVHAALLIIKRNAINFPQFKNEMRYPRSYIYNIIATLNTNIDKIQEIGIAKLLYEIAIYTRDPIFIDFCRENGIAKKLTLTEKIELLSLCDVGQPKNLNIDDKNQLNNLKNDLSPLIDAKMRTSFGLFKDLSIDVMNAFTMALISNSGKNEKLIGFKKIISLLSHKDETNVIKNIFKLCEVLDEKMSELDLLDSFELEFEYDRIKTNSVGLLKILIERLGRSIDSTSNSNSNFVQALRVILVKYLMLKSSLEKDAKLLKAALELINEEDFIEEKYKTELLPGHTRKESESLKTYERNVPKGKSSSRRSSQPKPINKRAAAPKSEKPSSSTSGQPSKKAAASKGKTPSSNTSGQPSKKAAASKGEKPSPSRSGQSSKKTAAPKGKTPSSNTSGQNKKKDSSKVKKRKKKKIQRKNGKLLSERLGQTQNKPSDLSSNELLTPVIAPQVPLETLPNIDQTFSNQSVGKIDIPVIVKEILNSLSLGPDKQALVVGGLVRNLLIAKQENKNCVVHDVDIVLPMSSYSSFHKEEMDNEGKLQSYLEINQVYKPKVSKHSPYRFTLEMRTENGPIKFDIVFSSALDESLLSDAIKRDFTFNALYSDQDGNIFDPTERGLKDLSTKEPWTILTDQKNELISFIEDPIRIFRYLGYLGQGYKPTYTKAQLETIFNKLDSIDRGIFFQQLSKLFLNKNAYANLQILEEYGFWQHIFPEISPKTAGYEYLLKQFEEADRKEEGHVNQAQIFSYIVKAVMKNELFGNKRKSSSSLEIMTRHRFPEELTEKVLKYHQREHKQNLEDLKQMRFFKGKCNTDPVSEKTAAEIKNTKRI